jgi:hypothetical protein
VTEFVKGPLDKHAQVDSTRIIFSVEYPVSDVIIVLLVTETTFVLVCGMSSTVTDVGKLLSTSSSIGVGAKGCHRAERVRSKVSIIRQWTAAEQADNSAS